MMPNQIIELKGHYGYITIELTLSVIGCYSKIIIIKKVLSEDGCKNNAFPNNITRYQITENPFVELQ
ncbi:unnamed protein product [Rhizophagus irregularis]|nr:unnamed protein product [Rhizophagus irregularis]